MGAYGRKMRIIAEERSLNDTIPLTIFNSKKKWGRPKDEWKQLTIRLLKRGNLSVREVLALAITYDPQRKRVLGEKPTGNEAIVTIKAGGE